MRGSYTDDDIARLTKAQMWGKFFLYAPKPEKADYVQKLTEANGGIKMAFTVLKNVARSEGLQRALPQVNIKTNCHSR